MMSAVYVHTPFHLLPALRLFSSYSSMEELIIKLAMAEGRRTADRLERLERAERARNTYSTNLP
jgi:hypothetical protein